MTQTPAPHDLDGFNVQAIREGEVVHLLLSGELDVASAPVLEDHLTAAEGNGARTILIDLALVTFIDSSGLYTFLRAARRSQERGKRLAFANCPNRVRRVFELTGTDSLLDEAAFTD